MRSFFRICFTLTKSFPHVCKIVVEMFYKKKLLLLSVVKLNLKLYCYFKLGIKIHENSNLKYILIFVTH